MEWDKAVEHAQWRRGIKGELFGARTVLPVSSLFFVTLTFFPIYSVVVVRCALCEGNISYRKVTASPGELKSSGNLMDNNYFYFLLYTDMISYQGKRIE